jgi:hypothetical protein
MKRAKGATKSSKRQKVPSFVYNINSDDQSEDFKNIRVVPWMKEDPILENRQQILTIISDLNYSNGDQFNVFRDASFLQLLVYDISNPWITKEKDSTAKFFAKIQASKVPILMGWGGARAFLLGFAVIQPWVQENVRTLTCMQIFHEDANLDHYLYKHITTLDSKIVLYFRRPPGAELSYWKEIGALAKTKEIWQPRNPDLLGLGRKDEVWFLKDINRSELAALYKDVGRLFASFRNWLLVYLCTALDCDTPILETISHAWPQGFCPIYRVGCIELIFPWQWDENKENQIPRFNYGKYPLFEINIQLQFGGYVPPEGNPLDVVYLSGSATSFYFKKAHQYQSLYHRLVPLFFFHGIRLQGSTFGHYAGLDQF